MRLTSRNSRGFLVAVTVSLVLSSISQAQAARPQPSDRSDEASDYGIAQVKLINEAIRQGWSDSELTPSKQASEGEWCRRVYLDTIGRIPSVTELRAFQNDQSPRKRVNLVSRLLHQEDYELDYARNWTTLWTNILIGRTGGTERDSIINRPGMMQYLRRCLLRNKPYNRMVMELVTATGTTKPGDPDFNGATNFLVEKYAEQGVQATAKTSQIFLGLQVQCTQCHNHPFNDWKQNQFWQMNAFFRQSHPLQSFDDEEYTTRVELIDESWEGESGDPAEALLFYELRNGLLKTAYPVFVDGTSLVDALGEEKGQSGYLEDVNRRQELAKMMVGSPYLPKALVNRYWSHFLGYGFTKPVDDLGPHNPPTHPELLDQLAEEFRFASFDLKQLILWITLSEPYSLSSRMTRGNRRDEPVVGEKPMFSHFYLRQMRAEELYESLLVATEAHKSGASYKEQEATKQKWLGQFGTAFGTDEGGESTTFDGTIPQVLMMMNGELISRATSLEKGGFLSRIASDTNLNDSEKVQQLYLAALSRAATKREMKMAKKLSIARGGNVAQALQDVWWVVLNSNEFILNH